MLIIQVLVQFLGSIRNRQNSVFHSTMSTGSRVNMLGGTGSQQVLYYQLIEIFAKKRLGPPTEQFKTHERYKLEIPSISS